MNDRLSIVVMLTTIILPTMSILLTLADNADIKLFIPSLSGLNITISYNLYKLYVPLKLP